KVKEVTFAGAKQLGKELKEEVTINILLGYLLNLGWTPISESYKKRRIRYGKVPEPSGHLLDYELIQAVRMSDYISDDKADIHVWVNPLPANKPGYFYESLQEFGWGDMGSDLRARTERPYFRPAVQKIIQKFKYFLREHLERAF
ncbi:MAG: hypothetical protein DRG33_06780, partial [Deltaproteobacteria bacterium]